MNTKESHLKVFISYCRTSTEYKEKVISLAKRLMDDGVDVKIDAWDLKEWNDLYDFMEGMVKDDTISKVLVICNEEYEKKSNKRKWGVWTETQIISKEVYDDVSQNKFIPIILEKKQDWTSSIPIYMKSRLYVDLSNDFEDNYEKLLRAIYDKPLHKKPVLGIAPSYITDEEPLQLSTAHKLFVIKNILEKDPSKINPALKDYFNKFIEWLKSYRIIWDWGNINEIDILIEKYINDMTPMRDDYLQLLEIIWNYWENIDLEILNNFFEDLVQFLNTEEIQNYNYSWDMIIDNYKFFLQEIILHTIRILLLQKNYKILNYILNIGIINMTKYEGSISVHWIEFFNWYVASLAEVKKQRLQSRQISHTVDFLLERCDKMKVDRQSLIDSDIFLYVVTLFKDINKIRFPRLTIYNNHFSRNMFFQKIISKSYFDKIKMFFWVKDKWELIKKLNEINTNYKKPSYWWTFWDSIPNLDQIFPPEESIASA